MDESPRSPECVSLAQKMGNLYRDKFAIPPGVVLEVVVVAGKVQALIDDSGCPKVYVGVDNFGRDTALETDGICTNDTKITVDESVNDSGAKSLDYEWVFGFKQSLRKGNMTVLGQMLEHPTRLGFSESRLVQLDNELCMSLKGTEGGPKLIWDAFLDFNNIEDPQSLICEGFLVLAEQPNQYIDTSEIFTRPGSHIHQINATNEFWRRVCGYLKKDSLEDFEVHDFYKTMRMMLEAKRKIEHLERRAVQELARQAKQESAKGWKFW